MAVSRFTTFLETFDADPKTRGTQWEHVCKWFLETDPVYRTQLKKIWLWSKWPGRWGPDAGIDLVAEAKDGTLWAIQAKAYAPDNAVTKHDVDSFLSESARAEFRHRLLIATTSRVSHAASRASKAAEKPVSMLLRHGLDPRDGVRWPVSFAAWKRGRFPKPKRKRPRPHQQKALRATLKKLKTYDRGQLILACGTGKTLTALWLHERLPSLRTLVLVPSLSLLGQTLQQWVANAKAPFETLPVCSDDTVRRTGDDAPMSSTLDLGYPSTTDPAAVRAFLKRRGPRVVFSTYQSSPVIASALAGTRHRFDLVIADEAHRCAGVVSSDFSTALDPKKIRARKRVFMTATPRYYTGRVVKEAKEADLDVASMNDESVFGPVFHALPFAEAIKRDLLTDYRVVIVGIDDDRYRQYAEQGRLVALDGDKKTDARTVAAHIGLAKAMRDYDMQRVISFHGRVSAATQFARTLPDIIDWMPRRERPSGTVWAAAVSGAMSSGDRATRLNRLRAVDAGVRGILSNARCLGEGIDVPTLDGVAFIDPKHSQVDIVQAVGRAIRKGQGKLTSTIVIPLFVDTEADGEAALDASAYRAIASVLRALRDHDADLAEELDALRRDFGPRSRPRTPWPPKIVLDLPRAIGADFSAAIRTAVVRLTTSSWEEGFAHLLAYVQAEGHARVRTDHRTPEGHRLGAWVAKNRSAKESMSSERRKRFDALEGWVWHKRDADWEEGFAALTAYVQAEGHALVPQNHRTAEGYRLGIWIIRQRYGQDRLSAARRERLEAVEGWAWDTRDVSWEAGYAALTTYVQAEGRARVRKDHRTAEGYLLGAWVSNQRTKQDRLSETRRERLEAVEGWAWNEVDAKWEEGFAALTAYVQAEGHALVPLNHRTAEGHRLGAWVNRQRSAKESMSSERRKRFDALEGWVWHKRDADWEEGFAALTAYVQAEGHALVPVSHRTAEGYRLGQWVFVQRQNQDRLSAARRERLEAVEGWAWDPLAKLWEAGYEALIAYVQAEGHARVPAAYRTADDYRLGGWVSRQRLNQDLSADRRQRLEAVNGWVWVALNSGWDEGYAALTAYVQAEGTARAPHSYRTAEGYRLGQWVSAQRSRQDNLSAARRKRLEALDGWVWKAV